jgi:predicted permease
MYQQVLEHVRALPGVSEAAFVWIVPLSGQRGRTGIQLHDPNGGPSEPIQVGFNVISPGYFSTVGISLVRGRDFSDLDRSNSRAVAAINEQMARRMFPRQDPVGGYLALRGQPGNASVEIVGIVRDGKFRTYRSDAEPTVYVPLAQQYRLDMNLEVRVMTDPIRMAGAIRTEIASLDRDLPLSAITNLKAHFDDALAQEHLTTSLLSGLGILALVLAAIGVYGVLSNSVTQRTREVGIRMALGAGARTVQFAVIRDAVHAISVGLIIGLVAALGMTRFIRSLLYGIAPTDPVVYVVVVISLLGVTLTGALIPARRASKTDPATVLRLQ